MFKKLQRRMDATAHSPQASRAEQASHTTPAGRTAQREPPHAASRYDAGTGQGTVSFAPSGKTLDRPVLDGSTESKVAQSFTKNPFRGRRDPALGEWNYSHAHEYDDDLENEPELRRKYDAEASAHANDLEPRRWYKYDPFRRERNRMRLTKGTSAQTAM